MAYRKSFKPQYPLPDLPESKFILVGEESKPRTTGGDVLQKVIDPRNGVTLFNKDHITYILRYIWIQDDEDSNFQLLYSFIGEFMTMYLSGDKIEEAINKIISERKVSKALLSSKLLLELEIQNFLITEKGIEGAGKCRNQKCGSTRLIFRFNQVRRSDEPMRVDFECPVCNEKWTV